MRVSKSSTSPWGKYIYFDSHEFEDRMDELRQSSGQECFIEGKGVDIDLITMRKYQCDPDYIILPENVLGRTIFSPDGNFEIQLSRQLAEKAETDKVARRRLRSTLAHEVGHISCHRELFLRDQLTIDLFSNEKKRPNCILCRESSVGSNNYSGEWWEYQANQCMAALLLPRRFLVERVNLQLKQYNIDTFENAIRAEVADQIIRNLCNQFDVSFEAILYRLKTLGFIPNENQRRLELRT